MTRSDDEKCRPLAVNEIADQVRNDSKGGVVLGLEAITTDTVNGSVKTQPGWAGRRGRRAGKRPQGMAKRLTLTERRLSFAFGEGTPRPEGQAFRQPRGGPMKAALNFSLTFLSREKEGNKASRRHRSHAPLIPTQG